MTWLLDANSNWIMKGANVFVAFCLEYDIGTAKDHREHVGILRSQIFLAW